MGISKQTKLGLRGTKCSDQITYQVLERHFLFPKGPVGLNSQLAFPLGMRTMSKRLDESRMDSEDIEEVRNGGMDNGIDVYLR